MRGICSLGGVVLLMALGLSCDSTSPLQLETTDLTISVTATNGAVPAYNIWDMYEDSDGDMQPDDLDGDGTGDLFLWCEPSFVSFNPTFVPIEFGAEISIVRAGTTEREVLTSPAGTLIDANLSEYDPAVQFGLVPAKNPITVIQDTVLGPVTRTFVFDNLGTFSGTQRRLGTAARREVVSATYNPLSEWGSQQSPVQYGHQAGLCSLADPGPANLDGQGLPLSITLNKGDTLIVEARLGDAADEMFFFPPGSSTPMSLISGSYQLNGELYLDGTPVSGVSGTLSSQTTFGSPITFSYTTR